ncbi:MAG: hypothetical protein IJB44_07350 [Clostridia bacterium]|nr:hypothetical protein [Clostridia bacterium]
MFGQINKTAVRRAKRTSERYEDKLRRKMLDAKRRMFSAQNCFNYALSAEDIDRCIEMLDSCAKEYCELYDKLKMCVCSK